MAHIVYSLQNILEFFSEFSYTLKILFVEKTRDYNLKTANSVNKKIYEILFEKYVQNS